MRYKNSGLILPVILFLAFFTSCSTKFKVDAPYKNITVVYGLLDVGDTAHYIRIEKAYLDENKSALDLAKIADSSYYAALDVKMREVHNGTVAGTFSLKLVDLTAEGLPKDTGVFFNTPSKAWKTTAPLNPAYTYRLVITNTATGEVDSSETNVIDNSPGKSAFYVSAWDAISSGPYQLDFLPNQPVVRNTFSLSALAPANAAVLEGVIRFRYEDSNVVTGGRVEHSLDWAFATTSATGGKTSTLSVPNNSFYDYLAGNIPVPSANIIRGLDSADVFIWAGNGDFYNYIQITNAASGGLTSDQVKPNFSNILGSPNTIGLFASRTFVAKYNVPVSDQTFDSLKSNATIAPVKFRYRTGH